MTHLLDRTRRALRGRVAATAGSAYVHGGPKALSACAAGIGASAFGGLRGQALNPSRFMVQPQ